VRGVPPQVGTEGRRTENRGQNPREQSFRGQQARGRSHRTTEVRKHVGAGLVPARKAENQIPTELQRTEPVVSGQ
jgi:hypothetical protein